MAYQPPLIGYKQLLNFGAYSIPDTGGWMLTAAGVLLFLVVLKEYKFNKIKES
jgi:copper chaperone NosL